jgi:RNA-binding protein YhbY
MFHLGSCPRKFLDLYLQDEEQSNKSRSWFSESAGMYQNLVKTVKDAFEVDEIVKVDCRELDRSDMKKIGAKLRVSPHIKLQARRYTITFMVEPFSIRCNMFLLFVWSDVVRSMSEILQFSSATTELLLFYFSYCVSLVAHLLKFPSWQDLVPCVPLSFDRHFMLLWKGSKLHGESQKRTEGNVLQEQLYADVSETADLTSAKEFLSDHEGQSDCNISTRESADADIALKKPEEAKESLDMNGTAGIGSKAVSEFDRLWQEAINSNEVVILDESEAGLDSVLEKIESHNGDSQSWGNSLNSWEEKPSELDNESSEMDEDGSTLGTWGVPRFSSGGEVDEDQEDGEQLEEVSNAEELLPSSLTDITIPQDELERLCALRLTIKGWMKIGRQGITSGIVKALHSKWLVSEIAKVRCIAPGCNMKEVHEDLEVSYHPFSFAKNL